MRPKKKKPPHSPHPGIFAKEQHLPAILAVPSLLQLKALYSRSLKSAQSLSEDAPSGVDLYSEDQDGKNFDKLLDRDDIQALIIALPILSQPDFIKKALAKGKHVLSEKPVAKVRRIFLVLPKK